MGGQEGDREIRERVLRELLQEGIRDVQVTVKERHVTLAGTVDSYGKKLAARDAAHRGAGFPELADDIQVVLPGTSARTDRELAGAVGRALEFDEFVPDRKIRFTVSRGHVTLEGDVESAREREDAARVVRHVAGVSGIDNRIRVQSAARLSPPPPLASRT